MSADPVADAEVELTKIGAVAVLRLNRPHRLNAFTPEMADSIIAAFDACDLDDTVRAVVMTGAGRAFCAGADLAAGEDTFVRGGEEKGDVPPDEGGQVSLRIFRSNKPVIAAVNGPAAGVGVTMTLPADMRIASDTAKFGFVFTRRGVVPEACSHWFLPRIVGIATALEWTLGGKMVSATEALERGLVREVVAPEQVLDRAIAIATELTEGTAPIAVAMTRRLMWRMLGAAGPETAHEIETTALYTRGRSEDVREGIAAFFAKRRPDFPEQVSTGLNKYFNLR
jgi:enoyl-CoA hydratase/carnithine racemase